MPFEAVKLLFRSRLETPHQRRHNLDALLCLERDRAVRFLGEFADVLVGNGVRVLLHTIPRAVQRDMLHFG